MCGSKYHGQYLVFVTLSNPFEPNNSQELQCTVVIHVHSPRPHLQMVSLYQDPEGLTVFKTGVTMAAATAKASSDQSTIESLRRRIRELETIVSQNVRTSFCILIESGTVGTEVYVCLAMEEYGLPYCHFLFY